CAAPVDPVAAERRAQRLRRHRRRSRDRRQLTFIPLTSLLMERIASTPRPGWEAAVEARGLKWHTGSTPYWSEDAYYRFTTAEVDAIVSATNDLHERCLEAVQHVIDERRYAELKIPEQAIPLIERSWQDEPPSLYGRFDLAYDGKSPPVMLEYNA